MGFKTKKNINSSPLPLGEGSGVRVAIDEDLAGQQDITALLVPEDAKAKAYVICREEAIVCGIEWVNEVFRQLDKDIKIKWKCEDGNLIREDNVVCELEGKARSLLTGERTALNFLQLLSATATVTYQYVQKLAGTSVKLLDSRKTIPGLRAAQKYAVRCGGGHNHRMGLYDAFLIKENHIRACGSISEAVAAARNIAKKQIEVEVEDLIQLQEAISAGADMVMLDNFGIDEVREAVMINKGKVLLEVSGNVSLDNIRNIAQLGVDFISVGALTKNVKAIDFSMQFVT